jgi:PTH1 family peptidyl-tRNA hydrolase
MQFYKIAPTDVWVVYDDVDVPFGRLRLRLGGSSGGGHQGVNSLISHLGPHFVRLKVGISLNDRTTEPSEIYVLKPFAPDERETLPTLLDHAAAVLVEQLSLEQPTDTTFELV